MHLAPIFEFLISPNALIVLVAGLLALAFDYAPVLAGKFDVLDPATKRLWMLGLNFVAAGIIFAGQCYGYFATNLFCDVKSAFDFLSQVFFAVSINYAVHQAAKPTANLQEKLGIK
jgi:hypothetical protein